MLKNLARNYSNCLVQMTNKELIELLQDVNLQNADLCGAILLGADLRGADLQGADLRGADLFGVKFDKQQIAMLPALLGIKVIENENE